MDSFADPETLRGRAGVPFHEDTRLVSREEFESVAESTDSHAVVGITNDEGEVLLMNDGSHGWTLIAFPVEPTEDWTAVASQEAARLLGVTVVVEQVELVRRIDFGTTDDDGQRTTMFNVVFRASVDGNLDVEEPDDTNDDEPSLGWFGEIPDEQDGETANDIRIFVA